MVSASFIIILRVNSTCIEIENDTLLTGANTMIFFSLFFSKDLDSDPKDLDSDHKDLDSDPKDLNLDSDQTPKDLDLDLDSAHKDLNLVGPQGLGLGP